MAFHIPSRSTIFSPLRYTRWRKSRRPIDIVLCVIDDCAVETLPKIIYRLAFALSNVLGDGFRLYAFDRFSRYLLFAVDIAGTVY